MRLECFLSHSATLGMNEKMSDCHSARNASVGFTDAARRAGRKLAAIDASPSSKVTQPRVTASPAFTPNNRLRISKDAPTEQTSPIANPVPVSHPACIITSLYTELRCAPSAMRTPIPRVRWLTDGAAFLHCRLQAYLVNRRGQHRKNRLVVLPVANGRFNRHDRSRESTCNEGR
jgi:hypothetical protein